MADGNYISPPDAPPDKLETPTQTLSLEDDGSSLMLKSTLPTVIPDSDCVWQFANFPRCPTTTPTADLEMAPKGYVDVVAVASKSGTYLATIADRVLLCTGTWTLTLYSATDNGGRQLTIKKEGAGTLTVAAAMFETIEGETTATIDEGVLDLVSDDSNWRIT